MRTLFALAVVAATAMPFVEAHDAHAAVGDDLRDGDRFFEAGQWARAAAAYDRAIAKAPGQVSAEAYGKRAAIFIILRDYPGGLAFVARAKLRYPSAPELLEQEALLLWETGKRDEAVQIAERVVAARPQAFTNQNLIGEYYGAREPAKVAAAYEAYLASRPSELENGDVLPRIRLGFAHVGLARIAIAAGDDARAGEHYGKAVTQFETVRRKHGKRPNATVNAVNGLCAAFTGLGRFDQAVTVCETAKQGKTVEPSVYFNLGTSYLARNQSKKARDAAVAFTKLRSSEARGFMLLGDTFFAERAFPSAIEQYTRAEKLLRPNQPHEAVQLSIRLGKTYRRLPAPATGANPNLALAIDKLSGALTANPKSVELAVELGGAYLEAAQDGKANALAERLLAMPEVVAAPADTRAAVLVIAGKAQFNQRKLAEARRHFEAAHQLRSADVTIRRALVSTINELAFETATSDLKAADALLDQALAIAPTSPVTVTNLAVLALERGECEQARKQLAKLETLQGHDPVVRTRLVARSFSCGKADPRRAAEAYALAEREARKANATLALAEIYTEWAPLTWNADLATAVTRLESAVQIAAQHPAIGPAARRNLALALWRRGWRAMRDGKPADAAADFDRALRDGSVLRGTEPLAFEVSHALALLEANRPAEATKLFKALAAKGNAASYLKPPFAKLGPQFFATYASYRTGSPAMRQQVIGELAKREREAPLIRELLASAWESIAFEQWRANQPQAAAKSLAQAEKYGAVELDRRVTVGRAALAISSGTAVREHLVALEALAGSPVEALVNLGILYDQLGRPRDAYAAWQRARARGAQARDLQKWIDAKKRIYGF